MNLRGAMAGAVVVGWVNIGFTQPLPSPSPPIILTVTLNTYLVDDHGQRLTGNGPTDYLLAR